MLDAVVVNDHPRCRISPDTYRTLLLLLHGAGLRISEALGLTLADVDLDAGILCVRESKFYKTRLVPIGKDLIRILTLYSVRGVQTQTVAATRRENVRHFCPCAPRRLIRLPCRRGKAQRDVKCPLGEQPHV